MQETYLGSHTTCFQVFSLGVTSSKGLLRYSVIGREAGSSKKSNNILSLKETFSIVIKIDGQSTDATVRSLHIMDMSTVFLVLEVFSWLKQAGSMLKGIIILSSLLLQCKMNSISLFTFSLRNWWALLP